MSNTSLTGSLPEPETITLDKFRIEELHLNPSTRSMVLTVSRGTIDQSGNYAPIRLLGNIQVEDTHYTEVEDSLTTILSTMFDKLQVAISNTGTMGPLNESKDSLLNA